MTLTLAGVAALALRKSSPADPSPRGTDASRRVSCLGHIEPENGVVVLSARSLMGQPSIVSALRVGEGDAVATGQVVAILNSHDQLEAAWREAEAHVALTERQLAQVEAGARSGDLAAQEAEVARLEAELAYAENEQRRFTELSEARAVAPSELDAKRTRVVTLRQMVQQAKNRLTSLSEVRKTDVDSARAAVTAARAAARRARAEYEPSVVRSPMTGHVIKIRAWPGEEIGPNGLMELGQTDRMYVFAEVPEQHIAAIRPGDPARITGDPVPAPLDGRVDHIGSVVGRGQVVTTDPAAFVDTRVVQVKIRLSDSAQASRLIHAQVSVVINP
jgi:HlyD family secretion protein